MYRRTTKSLVPTQRIFIYFIMLPQLIAKYVFGMDEFLYINDKNNADSIIKEITSASDLSFETSTKPRILEFYSPYCGHCIHFKKKYIQVAKETYERFTKDDIEFYAISCAGVEDLCVKYSIEFYPSLYAIPAGTSMINNRTLLQNGAFSLKDVEKVMKYRSGMPSSTKQRREEKELKKNDETQSDDGATVSDVENGNDEDEGTKGGEESEEQNDDGMKQKGDDGEEQNENGKRTDDDDPKDDNNQSESIGDEDTTEDEESELGTVSFDEELEKFKTGGHHAASIPMIASSKTVGAERAKSSPRTMDKWREILKQRLGNREHAWLNQKRLKLKVISSGSVSIVDGETEGATDIMLANRKGTKEYTQRHSDILKMMKKMKSSGHRKPNENPQEIENQLLEGQLPYKKRVAPMKIVERLPIIDHAVRMSHEEELILDASLSFLTALRVGIYKSDDPLPPKKQKALKDWLDLLHISLPPEWALQEAIGDLRSNFDEISNSRKALKDVLNQHMLPRRKWSRSCSRENGFSCGFWKMLHTITVGVAEYRGGQDLIASGSVMPTTRIFSPSDAADTIREYMAYFFPCDECSKHFIGQYDQCELNRRCDRLTDDPINSSDADWKELAMWLWEVHNDVSIRLLKEKHERKRLRWHKSLPETDQIKAIWPTIPACPNCLHDDGSFNENIVFLYLEQVYWPGYDLKDTPRRLILFEDDGQGAIGLNLILLLIGLTVVACCQKYISRASFAQTVLRAKTIGTRVVHGGKVRTT